MSKAVLMSIRPEWVEKMFSGEKIMEFRKTIPNCKLPCKYYIYATRPVGKVVGEFTLNYWAKFRLYPENKIIQWREESDWTRFFEKDSGRRSIKAGCVPFDQLNKYLNGKDGYALYIDDLKKYDQPKELSEFYSLSSSKCKFREQGYNLWSGHRYYKCTLQNCMCDMKRRRINDCECFESTSNSHKLTKAPQSWCYVEAK